MPAEQIRLLQLSDIPFAQELREIAGWNQTVADWERLIRFEPEGCFLVEYDGVPAGTATTTVHYGEVGWIGMVLVHPDFRRRGLATLLLKRCIDYLSPRTSCIKLDATPAGMLVYEKLGFVEESRLHRWEGRGIGASKPTMEAGNLPLALDRIAFGTDRSDFLKALGSSSRLVTDGDGKGFGLIREGMNAAYLGPVVADQTAAECGLVRELLSQVGDAPVYWDIFDANQPAVKLAEDLGFVKQRELIRMRLGKGDFGGDLSKQWAITGPETG